MHAAPPDQAHTIPKAQTTADTPPQPQQQTQPPPPPLSSKPGGNDAKTTGASGGSSKKGSSAKDAAGRKISSQDIQLVQNLIEKCLQLYMPLKEVVAMLQQQAKVEPGFTSLVWQKLEEQNPEFFRAYYLRLKVGGCICQEA